MVRQRRTTQALNLVPMGCQDETHRLVEISSGMAPSLAEERLVRGVQRFYAHLRALLDENERDALTRLHNRNSFDETFLRMALHIEEMDGYEAVPSTEDGERRLAVLLLKAVEPADACAAFERFRHTIESFEFAQVGRLTVSVGFTEVLNSDTPSAACDRADNAANHAKKLGTQSQPSRKRCRAV